VSGSGSLGVLVGWSGSVVDFDRAGGIGKTSLAEEAAVGCTVRGTYTVFRCPLGALCP